MKVQYTNIDTPLTDEEIAAYSQVGDDDDSPGTQYDGTVEAEELDYDRGGFLSPAVTIVRNDSGEPERVSPPGGSDA